MRHTEEDWERISFLDKMYLQEKEKEIEEEWQQWEEEKEKERLPAKIVVKTKKEQNEKVHIDKESKLSSSRNNDR